MSPLYKKQLFEVLLESTIPAYRMDGEAGFRTSTAQMELELGLSLAIKSKLNVRIEGNIENESCSDVKTVFEPSPTPKIAH